MFTYNDKDINGKLMQNLWEVTHILRHTSGAKLSQKRILTVLLRNGMISQSELTKYLRIQSGSASEVLSKLETAGLILRTESETDRRAINISLTAAGEAEAAVALKAREERKADMFSVLSEDEKADLLLLLEKLTAVWKKR